MPGVTYLWFCNVCANSALERYTLSSEGCVSNTEIVNAKDILKIAIDAKAFWICYVDVDKKKTTWFE